VNTSLVMKRKSKPRGWFHMMLSRGPRINSQWAVLRCRYDDLCAAGLVEAYLDFFRGWVDFAEAEYATLGASASFGNRSEHPSFFEYEGARVPTLSGPLLGVIPDLYWINVSGPAYVGHFGKEKLLAAPAAAVEEDGRGRVWLKMAEEPHLRPLHRFDRSETRSMEGRPRGPWKTSKASGFPFHCPGCETAFNIQADLEECRALDVVPPVMGPGPLLPFPADDKFRCPKCGTEADLAFQRKYLEGDGIAVPAPLPPEGRPPRNLDRASRSPPGGWWARRSRASGSPRGSGPGERGAEPAPAPWTARLCALRTRAPIPSPGGAKRHGRTRRGAQEVFALRRRPRYPLDQRCQTNRPAAGGDGASAA
jgi:hypothetical protein